MFPDYGHSGYMHRGPQRPSSHRAQLPEGGWVHHGGWRTRNAGSLARPQHIFNRLHHAHVADEDGEFEETVLLAELAAAAAASADRLIVVGLFSPASECLRRELLAHLGWLGGATGDRCSLILVGDPRHSDDQFLDSLAELGLDRAVAQHEWDEAVARHGDPVMARQELNRIAAQALGLALDQLPCFVLTTTRLLPERRVLRLPSSWWLGAKAAHAIVARMMKAFSADVVAAMLEQARGQDPEPALASIEKPFRLLRKGVDFADAYGLAPVSVEVLRWFQKAEIRRYKTREIIEGTGVKRGTLPEAIRPLVDLGVVDHDPGERNGYWLTPTGRAFEL